MGGQLIRFSYHDCKSIEKQATGEFTETSKESERFYIILLSIIPGLGHFQLGLMQRGLTF